jgi:C1A family cysteine protease
MNKWNGKNFLFSENMKLALEAETQKSFLAAQSKLKDIVLPYEFDWRKERPECITSIKDQLYCGSCYSFSVTGALESRFCIASNGKMKPELSQQDIVSCDANNHKCRGDRIDNTWKYLETVGTCSLACKPYTSHHGDVDSCDSHCSNPNVPFYRYKAKAGSWRIMNNPTQIKQEIFTKGPVSAGMATFEDLWTYKGGVYIHTAGNPTDHHAIVLVGWGYDFQYKCEYWIVRNSWGTTWGENGYGKVLFGMYEINEMVNASDPLI